MKIDEASINHNVAKLIHELDVWELRDESMRELQLITLGYVRGVTELGEALKGVLKA